MLNRIMKDENGVLTFEWILLITLLVIGIIGGIAAIRDALIIECAETAGAIVALNQAYTISGPWMIEIKSDTTTIVSEYSGYPSLYSDKAGTVKVTATAATTIGGEPTPTP